MNKKSLWIIAVIALLAASQWLAVKLVYAHKIDGRLAQVISKTYGLTAGTVKDADETISVSLDEYFDNRFFVKKYLFRNEQPAPTQEELDVIAWDRMVRLTWLEKIKRNNNIEISQADIDEHIANIKNLDGLKKVLEELGISWEEYQEYVIEPFILEVKVYEYLIENYNDLAGVQKAQQAYDSIKAGMEFEKAAMQFSDDPLLAQQSIWLGPGDYVDFYEPIADLDAGEISKIVKLPGSYIIWKVNSVVQDEETGQELKEVTGLFIIAKSLDEFLNEYKEVATIERKY